MKSLIRERFIKARKSGELSEGRQRGRLHKVSVDDHRRSLHPGSEWFNEGGTQADRPDGPSASGLLRATPRLLNFPFLVDAANRPGKNWPIRLSDSVAACSCPTAATKSWTMQSHTSVRASTPAATACSTKRTESSSNISSLPTWTRIGGSPARSAWRGDAKKIGRILTVQIGLH